MGRRTRLMRILTVSSGAGVGLGLAAGFCARLTPRPAVTTTVNAIKTRINRKLIIDLESVVAVAPCLFLASVRCARHRCCCFFDTNTASDADPMKTYNSVVKQTEMRFK